MMASKVSPVVRRPQIFHPPISWSSRREAAMVEQELKLRFHYITMYKTWCREVRDKGRPPPRAGYRGDGTRRNKRGKKRRN